MKTMKDLFEHQLKDLYSVETQLVKALPVMVKKGNDSELKQTLKNHLKETKQHKSRLETICRELNIAPKGETCKAMAKLIKKTNRIIAKIEDDEVMDVGLIAEAQQIEHYEISGYGSAIRYAKELGYRNIAKRLQETLDEEYESDNKLNKLAEGRLNKKAIYLA
ncbi:ferritin-like domain-containing protein [Aurantibacter crassamenti]|uniref:YciE/YciF ferroxidase family protein n=1 Tax=Aurantibacter crassamenti TaxID=1837375 RepID=UPI0019393A36|nr:ferritin-like domain-containing protein [Aurantibacter crassamenti]MBM1105892.1 ferritin-like domain-containing protein [Aurantibacter crassamenti]